MLMKKTWIDEDEPISYSYGLNRQKNYNKMKKRLEKKRIDKNRSKYLKKERQEEEEYQEIDIPNIYVNFTSNDCYYNITVISKKMEIFIEKVVPIANITINRHLQKEVSDELLCTFLTNKAIKLINFIHSCCSFYGYPIRASEWLY